MVISVELTETGDEEPAGGCVVLDRWSCSRSLRRHLVKFFHTQKGVRSVTIEVILWLITQFLSHYLLPIFSPLVGSCTSSTRLCLTPVLPMSLRSPGLMMKARPSLNARKLPSGSTLTVHCLPSASLTITCPSDLIRSSSPLRAYSNNRLACSAAVAAALLR